MIFLPPIRAYSAKEEERVVDATENYVEYLKASGQKMREFNNDYIKTLVDNNWPEEALWRVLEPRFEDENDYELRLEDENDYVEFMFSISSAPYDPALAAKLLKVVFFYSPQDELLVHSAARKVAILRTRSGFEDFRRTIDNVGVWSSQQISDANLALPLYECLSDQSLLSDMVLDLAKLSSEYLYSSIKI
jgi:hypothetical protein